MWSALYWYYELRGDSTYSHQLPTDLVLKVLEETGVLLKKGKQLFYNAEGFPWIDVSVINSVDGSYGHPKDFNSKVVTLIAVVGSKGDPAYESLYMDLLMGIAEKLNWELIEEGAGDDGEDIVLRSVLRS
ncbi:hypothetical protein L3C95_30265 [Chitinophaga filiformis]|uniref:hypothetical protein n=1 Tax=Chitinophaga filiformis TaxID=104663 RepID=UPI001F31306A|nr:hypothetical protein [Chitinophaga filiformis]MCF6407220.1 hypothetical protein [Chitinophaga filiformis]